ncbi:MAG TPA: ATP-dependent Clp protease proteolytic subunit, partial [Mycobacteriales bacterium]|nr:ATP-dependent Clp protease proteolytic subunit [Mycobacteriales bacterium]
PVERITADADRDRWFTAAGALDYGIVDHVVTTPAGPTDQDRPPGSPGPGH